MMRFDPFREIEELTQRMDRAFGGAVGNQTARLAPPIDIHEDEQGLDLTLDLPGVQPGDIQIEAENNTLTVQGQRKYDRQEGRTSRAAMDGLKLWSAWISRSTTPLTSAAVTTTGSAHRASARAINRSANG